jgi:hypothetical protein
MSVMEPMLREISQVKLVLTMNTRDRTDAWLKDQDNKQNLYAAR